MTYVIGAGCIDVKDRSCLEECPVDCIYEGERKLYINPVECIHCGACETACPVSAVVEDRKIPDAMTAFVQDNERFFIEPLPGRDEPLGAPGGASLVGAVGVDTDLVRDWSAS